jgi:hypothetical protein
MYHYNIRKLESQQDLEKFEEIWCERNKRMKTPVADQRAEFQRAITVGTTIGAFDQNDQLIGVLRYLKFQTLPYGFIYNLHIKKGTMHRYNFSDEKNPITYILDFILTEFESQGIYTWYYTRAISRGYHKIFVEGTDLFTKSKMCFDKNTSLYRYERYIEEFIPAGEKSKIQSFNHLLLDRTYKTNLTMFKCCLKNQFRPYGDVLVNESKYY